jgi:uncharacterized protein
VTGRLDPGLPIFLVAGGATTVAYTPGHLAVIRPEDGAGEGLARAASALKAAALQTVEKWRQRQVEPYAPECLTVYLNNRCNLRCSYCYAASGRAAPQAVVEEAAALAAAAYVLRNCAARGRPFHLVLHGGGEPTLEWTRVTGLVEATRSACRRENVAWFGFLATNGVLTASSARWLAANLSLIEISCDGPPDIQDRQRPARSGRATSAFVERTARILREAGCPFEVRATITPESVERQAEIVEYLHAVLGAARVRFEPVYRVRSDRPAFRPDQAGWFAAAYRQAESRARALGVELALAGARLDEIHGPYCDLTRQVFHLLPDGGVSACFFATDSAQLPGCIVGRWDGREFALDGERIAERRRRAFEIPARCSDCVNAYHCARECPERCAVDAGPDGAPGFRCELYRRLAEAWILDLAI